MNTLINADCLTISLPNVKCIFCDPPDNIGLWYNQYNDKLDTLDYEFFLKRVITLAVQKCEIFWLSYNSKHELMVTSLIQRIKPQDWTYKKLIWTFTFGQYGSHDFGPCYRPIVRLMKKDCATYPETILEESERMRMGDSRAAGPRMPSDVWEFPRVVGNSRERQPWHPTQFPVVIYDRIMKFSCSFGDTFLDMMCGSGTIFRAGVLNPGINIIGIEIDSDYCKHLEKYV